MKKRFKMSKSSSKKMFSRNAMRTKSANNMPVPMRGGFRF